MNNFCLLFIQIDLYFKTKDNYRHYYTVSLVFRYENNDDGDETFNCFPERCSAEIIYHISCIHRSHKVEERRFHIEVLI